MIFALDPIKQFEIHKMGPTLKIGNFDLSFTNASLMMLVTVALVVLWLLLSTSKRSLVPTRAQSIAEVTYEFVADMIQIGRAHV